MEAGISYELALSQPFLESLDDLDKASRKAVRDTLDKVQAGTGAVRVHKLEGVPFVSFVVNQGGLRVICQRDAGTLILCHVGKHDAAYDWAKRHRIVQVGKHVRIVRTTEGVEEAAPVGEPAKGPLADVKDDAFARFDIAAKTAGVLRAVDDDDTLLDVLAHFPPHRGEALMSLAIDPDDVASIAETYRMAEKAGLARPSLPDALRDDVNAAQFWMPSPEDDAYRKALEGGIAAWRVFLHPSQRRIVRMDARGALKVGGGPGTGKTVVALHRAKHLAELFASSDPRPVLLTTFSSALAKQLEAQLDEICAGADSVRERIVVLGTTRVAQELLRAAGRPNRLITAVDDAWAAALAQDWAGRGRRFYESERVHVVARHAAWSEEDYLRAARTGRTKRLDRPGRKEVWAVLAAFDAALAREEGGDDLALARDATSAVATGAVAAPYAAIVCDEAQDLGAAELRMLAALVRDGDVIRPNALTLCGDGYQRLYRAPVSLLACGIETRGRSRTLRLNYRTTEAIRRAAVALVAGQEPDEIDQGEPSAIEGYRALRRGVAPEERSFDTPEAEAAWVAERGTVGGGTLLVLARTNEYLEQLRARLAALGVAARILGAQDLLRDDDEVVLATLHRAKGLEAPRVIIAGRHAVPAKYPGGGDPADRALWDRTERSLLYVGMTRARDWCATTLTL